jgi:hypothetical protein
MGTYIHMCTQAHEQGCVDNMCKLLCDQGFHHVFGWEQDVAISVNSIAEATLVVKSNVSTSLMYVHMTTIYVHVYIHVGEQYCESHIRCQIECKNTYCHLFFGARVSECTCMCMYNSIAEAALLVKSNLSALVRLW